MIRLSPSGPPLQENWRRESQEGFDILSSPPVEILPDSKSPLPREKENNQTKKTDSVAVLVLSKPIDPKKLLNRRFRKLERESGILSYEHFKEASTSYALKRNRYTNVKPASFDLVSLKDGSYINASRYENMIITQGPFIKEEIDTVGDFWQLAFEQADDIVCLTDPLEQKKTHPYWEIDPDQKEIVYKSSELFVRLLEGPFVVVKPNIIGECVTLRLFEIHWGNQKKVVTHWYYEKWEDHSICDPAQLALLIKHLVNKSKGPIIHCSAGIGRSGVFAVVFKFAIRYLILKRIPSEDEIDQAVIELRQRRPGSIQGSEQLDLISKTFAEFLKLK